MKLSIQLMKQIEVHRIVGVAITARIQLLELGGNLNVITALQFVGVHTWKLTSGMA